MIVVTVPTELWDDNSPGVISTWLFDDGDRVSQGDVVAEGMNGKISFDVRARASGICRIIGAAEAEVSQGDTIGHIET